ncbi:MAG: hypothetical protein NVS2B12_02950 [Ktedonobacteraceae bacterium]
MISSGRASSFSMAVIPFWFKTRPTVGDVCMVLTKDVQCVDRVVQICYLRADKKRKRTG